MELGPPLFQSKQGSPYPPPSLPQLIFHFSSRPQQNERRFHFTSVISGPACYLRGDKCLTDCGRR